MSSPTGKSRSGLVLICSALAALLLLAGLCLVVDGFRLENANPQTPAEWQAREDLTATTHAYTYIIGGGVLGYAGLMTFFILYVTRPRPPRAVNAEHAT